MRILIVDDEPHVMRVLTLCLRREGYEVDSASDGAAALTRIRSQPPDFLITDISMPGMNGEQLCRAIHAEFPQRRFPILVMTSMTGCENREWASRIPNTDFLEKPLSPRNLIARLAGFAARP
ncbi:MAG: response regulator [Burkholderiales bacterium]|jgi:CheY-like chemotaxis protein